jgi:CRP/FNR family transcriptional regulator
LIIKDSLSYFLENELIEEIIKQVDGVNKDERLKKYLIDQAKLLGSLEIHHTTQQIAEDLHSSRVVISRLLKQLEIKGEIKLHRNKIILRSI